MIAAIKVGALLLALTADTAAANLAMAPTGGGGGGGVSVVQTATPGQNGGSGTSRTASFGANTGTGRHGVMVGLFFCLDNACSAAASDPFIGGTVTIGSNACSEMPGAYQDIAGPPNIFATTIFICPNLASAATLITAATNGTAVWYLAVFGTEIICPTSGCVIDGTIGNGNAVSATSLSLPASGATSATGDFVYSIAVTANGFTLTAGNTALSTISGGISDEWVLGGSSGTTPSASWTSTAAQISASIAAVKP